MSDQKLNIKWILISLVIFIIVQFVLGAALTLFSFLTFGLGAILFLVFKPLVYFIGGVIAGYLSPGVTIKEPAIAAIIVVVGGTLLESTHLGFGGFIAMAISGLIAFFAATYGAKIGEKMQGNRGE